MKPEGTNWQWPVQILPQPPNPEKWYGTFHLFWVLGKDNWLSFPTIFHGGFLWAEKKFLLKLGCGLPPHSITENSPQQLVKRCSWFTWCKPLICCTISAGYTNALSSNISLNSSLALASNEWLNARPFQNKAVVFYHHIPVVYPYHGIGREQTKERYLWFCLNLLLMLGMISTSLNLSIDNWVEGSKTNRFYLIVV